MTDLDAEIGRRLAVARKNAGLSQDELALRLRSDQSLISNWELGRRSLNVNWLVRFAEELGVDPTWLLTGVESSSTMAMQARRIASAASALRTVANTLTSMIEAGP